MSIRFVASDVDVLPIPPELCGECNQDAATHFVQLDLRGTGQTFGILKGCRECCTDFANRLRDTLPALEAE